MAGITRNTASVGTRTTCDGCNERITLFHVNGRYLTAGAVIVPLLLSLVGRLLGNSISRVAPETAKNTGRSLAVLGVVIGGFSVYLTGDPEDSIQCPLCKRTVVVEGSRNRLRTISPHSGRTDSRFRTERSPDSAPVSTDP